SGSFIAQHDGALSYIAESSTTAIRMNRHDFISAIKSDPSLMSEYLNMTLCNQLLLIDRIVYQGEKGLYAKCVRWLLFMAKYYGKENGNGCTITVPLTQDTIANFLHATRESVNGVLRQLQEEKHITISAKRITIIHTGKLKKLLD
ncbi:Crp/Fnr family transcriptional regulator, partial [Patescibacteria group bacterium]|nr:Crp/Fnr family transcriptional regulator [Patescibacteria group bacterium]